MQLQELMPYWTVVGAALDRCLERLPAGSEEHRPVPGFPTPRTLFARLQLALSETELLLGGGLAPDRAAAAQTAASARSAFADAFSRVAGGLAQPAPADPAGRRALVRALWSKLDKVIAARAQIHLYLSNLGVQTSLFARPEASTPAAAWPAGPVEARELFQRWPHLQRRALRAIQSVAPALLGFRPGPGRPALGDLLLHIPVRERYLLSLVTGRHPGPEPIAGDWFSLPVTELWQALGDRFGSPEALAELWRRVRRATAADLAGLTTSDLQRQLGTPYGLASGHYTLWYALEHGLHHLAQVELLAAIARSVR